MNKKIIIISEGPPPLGSTPAEGGALRAWGLAKGLANNGLDITLAYRSTFRLSPDYKKTKIPRNVKLDTWDGEKIDNLIANHKIIILRYAMGEAEEFTRRLNKEHILVSDSYIPISIEVSARNSNDKDENNNYLNLQEICAIASRRADYFLYASPAQKNYYLGYLSALNKINPITYKEFGNRLFEVPYGVDIKDIPKGYPKSSKSQRPTLLWYGAFYSWFDMESLIESVAKLKKEIPNFRFLIAGAKNPYNKNPALLNHYNKTIKSLEVLGDTVEMIDWSPYEKRFEIYKEANAIITFNHMGLENELAWRTRLMDYLLAHKPIITNGGDPLGEDLIKRGIAYRASGGEIVNIFKKVLKTEIKEDIFNDAIERYSWDKITKSLAIEMVDPSRLPSVEMVKKIHPFLRLKRIIKRILSYPLIIFRYIKKNGVKKTINRIIRKN